MWFVTVLHFQQAWSKRNFLSAACISCCCHLTKTWNDLSFAVVIVFNGTAARYFQGQCQVLSVQITVKSWAIIWWIWSSQVTSLNNSDADGAKLFSLFRAVQQIASAPPLDLCSFRLCPSDWLEQIYALFFFGLEFCSSILMASNMSSSAFIFQNSSAIHLPSLWSMDWGRILSLSCMCILYRYCFFSPQQKPLILK